MEAWWLRVGCDGSTLYSQRPPLASAQSEGEVGPACVASPAWHDEHDRGEARHVFGCWKGWGCYLFRKTQSRRRLKIQGLDIGLLSVNVFAVLKAAEEEAPGLGRLPRGGGPDFMGGFVDGMEASKN